MSWSEAYTGTLPDESHPDDAKQLIAIGDSKPRAADPVQLASWTMLTNELLNLDEVLCK